MALIVFYLRNGILLENYNASRRLTVRAFQFLPIGDVLYKRGFLCPYLRCLVPEKADYVMREVQEGVCRNHAGA